MTNDLTKERPWRLLLKFTLPIFVGNIFQQLYNMVDMIIVGRTIGADALAGVGATGAIGFLIIGFVIGLTGGFAVMTSQCFGAKNERDVRRSVATSLMLSLALTVVLTVVSVLTVKPLLRLMRTPAAFFDYAYDYIIVICWGMGATVFYNMISNIIRALGDSVTPLIFLIVASLLNVALDFWFIMGLKMGVAGAGLATVLSQLLSGIMCTVYMLIKFKILRLKAEDFKTNFNWCKRHLFIGLPMAFQFSITAIGVMVQQAALNGLGDDIVIAYSAANKIDNLATQALLSLGTAMATFCGQNYGAGEYGRIKSGVRTGMIFAAVASCLACALVCIFGGPMTRLFIIDPKPEIVDYSARYLVFQGFNYIWLGVIFIYRNSLQGMGKSVTTVFAGVIEVVMRVGASFALIIPLGFLGACLSNPLAWAGAAVFLLVVYYLTMRGYKRCGKLIAKTQQDMVCAEGGTVEADHLDTGAVTIENSGEEA